MSLWRKLSVMWFMVLLISACGSDSDNKTAPEQSVIIPTATAATPTLVEPTRLPPTWTPRPTLTAVPIVILPSITPRPTATSFTIPTYTPFPDGRNFSVISPENAIQLAEVSRREQTVYDFAWGQDGSLAVAMGEGARVYAGFNLSETPRLLKDTNPGLRAYKTASVAISPDGLTVATGNAYGEVRVWELQTQRELFVLTDNNFDVNDLIFAPDGTTLYAASFERVVKIWDTQTGTLLRTLDLNGGSTPFRLALHPSGSPLLATSLDSKRLYVWDTQTGELLTTIPAASNAIGLALSSDGQIIAYPDQRTVTVWDFDDLLSPDGEPLATLADHDAEIWEIALSPDGRLLAVALSNGMVYLWDTTSAERVTAVQAGSNIIRTLSFSPDGKFLLTGSSPDGLWIVWGIQQ